MSLNTSVVLNISLADGAVTQASLGTILLLGHNATFPERINFYVSIDEVEDAGFTAGQYEHGAATAIVSQSLRPAQIAIGRADAYVAQIVQVNVNAAVAGTYSLVLTHLGMPALTATYTAAVPADTTTVIRDALVAAVNALFYDPPTNAEGIRITAAAVPADPDSLTLTSDEAGWGFTCTLAGANVASMTQATNVANNGPQQELADIATVDDSWYGLCIQERSEGCIHEAAAYVETRIKQFWAQSDDANNEIAGTVSDIATRLDALNRLRTLLLHYGTDGTEAVEAWFGTFLAVDPDDKVTAAAHRTLAGITTDAPTTTQQTVLEGRHANYYGVFGGEGATFKGFMAEGHYADEVLTRDWLYVRLLADIQTLFLQVSNRGERIPYTDAGIARFRQVTDKRLRRGVDIGHLVDVPRYTITMPKRTDVDPADVTARTLSWSFIVGLAGAIHEATITGNVEVTL